MCSSFIAKNTISIQLQNNQTIQKLKLVKNIIVLFRIVFVYTMELYATVYQNGKNAIFRKIAHKLL